jgi:excisionase family DNA binding protein
MTMESLKDYISTKDASSQFGLSREHISRLARKGTVRARKVERDWLVYLPSLKAYLASNPRPGLKVGQKIRRK